MAAVRRSCSRIWAARGLAASTCLRFIRYRTARDRVGWVRSRLVEVAAGPRAVWRYKIRAGISFLPQASLSPGAQFDLVLD